MGIIQSLSDSWSKMSLKREASRRCDDFIDAAKRKDYLWMETCLRDNGGDLDKETLSQALMHMTQQNNVPLMEQLIARNADVNANNWTVSRPCLCGTNNCPGHIAVGGATPLMVAVVAGHVEAMDLLLKNDADPLATLQDKSTALTLAAFNKRYNMLPALIKAEAGIDLKPVKKRAPKPDAPAKGRVIKHLQL